MAYEISIDSPASESVIESPATVYGTAYLIDDKAPFIKRIPAAYQVVVDFGGGAVTATFGPDTPDWNVGPFNLAPGTYDVTAKLHVSIDGMYPMEPNDIATATDVEVQAMPVVKVKTVGHHFMGVEDKRPFNDANHAASVVGGTATATVNLTVTVQGEAADNTGKRIICALVQHRTRLGRGRKLIQRPKYIRRVDIILVDKIYKWTAVFENVRDASYTAVAYLVRNANGKIVASHSKKRGT